MKTFAEQIAALKATRQEKFDEMKGVAQKSVDQARSMDTDEQEQFDTLESEIKRLDDDIARLSKLADMDRATAKVVDDTDKRESPATGGAQRLPVQVKNTQKLEKGIRFARYAMCLASAKGDIHTAKSIAENRYRDDDVINGVMKAAVSAGTTTDPSWAGPLVAHNELTSDFIEYLRPRTIIGRFGRDGIPALRPVPFNVHIKGQTAGGTAGWVGEGAAKPVTSFGYNDIYLGWAKVAAISVITEELARFSSPGAEGLVRDGLADAVIARIDADFVDPGKEAGTGASASPASITHGATSIASTATDADDVRKEIANLWQEADTTNLPTASAVYITDVRTVRALSLMRNPLGQREFPEVNMAGGMLEGIPVIVSNYVPNASTGSTFILAFASEIMLADDNLVTLSASREASIAMDTQPKEGSGNLVSMFQTNSIALRAERYINWAKRRDSAVAYLKDVNWGQ